MAKTRCIDALTTFMTLLTRLGIQLSLQMTDLHTQNFKNACFTTIRRTRIRCWTNLCIVRHHNVGVCLVLLFHDPAFRPMTNSDPIVNCTTSPLPSPLPLLPSSSVLSLNGGTLPLLHSCGACHSSFGVVQYVLLDGVASLPLLEWWRLFHPPPFEW